MIIPGLTQPVLAVCSGLAPHSTKLNRNLLIALKRIPTVILKQHQVNLYFSLILLQK